MHKSGVTQIFGARKSGVTQISHFIMLSYVTCGVRFCCSVLVGMLVAVLTSDLNLDVVQNATCWLIKSYCGYFSCSLRIGLINIFKLASFHATTNIGCVRKAILRCAEQSDECRKLGTLGTLGPHIVTKNIFSKVRLVSESARSEISKQPIKVSICVKMRYN